MGASLDTPARCPLCNEHTADPVTLKCKHRFCQRCIGDLWSVAPNGPYHCPEWRCKTVYHTLPFDGGLIGRRPTTNNRSAWPRSAAATASNSDQKDSALRRPTLSSRLLGKRKASAPVTEQLDSKRSAPEPRREQVTDQETPSTSFSDSVAATPATPATPVRPVQSTSVETPKEGGDPKSTQPERGDAKSSGSTSDSVTAPSNYVPPEVSVQQAQPEPKVFSLDDSDSSDEVDICDAPTPKTPEKDAQVKGISASPVKPASLAFYDSVPVASTPSKDMSPLPSANKSPLMFNKNLPSPSGSLYRVPIFPRSEKKNSSPVPCHYCPKSSYKFAVKTCLVCGASMCTEHLRPHLDSPVFQNHTLVPPMEDISTWRCQEHQEINRIYCRQCRVCVCTVCTVIGSHRDHVCISIREAERELRDSLVEDIKQLQETEEQVNKRLTELTQKKETFSVVLREARAAAQQQYLVLREALDQEEQTALQCVAKEENRVLGGLDEKLSHLRTSLQSVQQGLHILEGLADAKGDTRIQDQAFIVEYSKTAHLAATTAGCLDQFEAPEEVDEAKLKCLQQWTEKRLDAVVITVPGKDRDLYRLLYGSVPSLDADTAHPKLHLSDNNRRATYSEAQQAYVEHEARFSSFPQVLADAALRGGRCYWEVKVCPDEGRWKVGLCEAQMERKGQRDGSRLGFNPHSWCLACDRKKVEALHNKVAQPVEADGLRRVGVFLDFEEGVLSFFSVTPGGSLVLMHSYKHRFTEPLYPALSVSKTYLVICDLFQS